MFLSRYFSKKKKKPFFTKMYEIWFLFFEGEYVNTVMALMAGSVL